MNKLEQAARQSFETWWEREGQEFLFALNTTTDDDIKLVAEIAWKNGAYCAEQAEQERKYGELAGTHNWTPPNYTDEQWQKLDQEYQDHVAEQALQKLSDFHQSIEHDGHWSDCSVHNEPAYPNGPCDCGGYPPKHWRCACGANLYIDSNGAPASKAEQEPECKYKEAYIIWQDKTEWVQETAQPKELGMHRADVLRQRIQAAALAEREACARVCDDMGNTEANMNKTWRNGCSDAAAAIRARGNK